MSVDHCGVHASVSKQFLDGSDVVAILQKVGGKRVSEDVARDSLRQAERPTRLLHGPLYGGGVKMESSSGPGMWIGGGGRRREDELPAEFDTGQWRLVRERVR